MLTIVSIIMNSTELEGKEGFLTRFTFQRRLEFVRLSSSSERVIVSLPIFEIC